MFLDVQKMFLDVQKKVLDAQKTFFGSPKEFFGHRSGDVFCGNGVGVRLTAPSGLALSGEKLFVSDAGNHRVLQVYRGRSGEVTAEVVQTNTKRK